MHRRKDVLRTEVQAFLRSVDHTLVRGAILSYLYSYVICEKDPWWHLLQVFIFIRQLICRRPTLHTYFGSKLVVDWRAKVTKIWMYVLVDRVFSCVWWMPCGGLVQFGSLVDRKKKKDIRFAASQLQTTTLSSSFVCCEYTLRHTTAGFFLYKIPTLLSSSTSELNLLQLSSRFSCT